jgi:hypothetical protein
MTLDSMHAQPLSHYTCYKTRTPLLLDGKLDKAVWRVTPRSRRFVDIVSGAPAIYDSRAAALWDDNNLYISFWCEEPFVSAEITERDSLIFLENDVEVFIDGGDTYYEFEINALGTIYEVFYIWHDAYQRGSRFDIPEFDVFSRKALTFGGNHDRSGANFWWGTHPRKLRWAFLDWDLPGLQTAVHVDGEINNPNVRDSGWSVELAFPWQGMHWLANGRSLPPNDGDLWRIFFGRYQKMILNGTEIHPGWAWDTIGSSDNHLPERFTHVHFSETYIEDMDFTNA